MYITAVSFRKGHDKIIDLHYFLLGRFDQQFASAKK
jgi:hypothetical protein